MQGFFRRLADSPGTPLAAFGLLFSLATVALFLTDLQTRYWDGIAAAKKDARSFANILAQHTALTFEDVDRALREAAEIRKNSLSTRTPDRVAVNAALRQLQRSSSVFVGIGWTDASGEIHAHSGGQAAPRSDISDMPHFIAQRDNASDQLAISPPFLAATGDRWFTGVSRRLNNPDGSFAGVVAAAIDQSYFSQLYRSVDLGQGGTIFLMHREGLLLAREPEKKDAIGKSFANGMLIARYLPISESGAYETETSVVDSIARIVGYKTVPGLPLVLAVSYARSEVLRPWYRHLYTYGLLVFAIVTVILFGTFLLVRQTNALAGTNARFEAALGNMPHGLTMLDANQRLLVTNARYREIYGVTEAQTRPGTPLKRILEDFEVTGKVINLNVERYVQRANELGQGILTLTNGRIISITRTPMKDGGWVATHEDITEKRHAEARLVENAAELERTNERFRIAISNMSQGLCLFDADKRLVISNRQYQEMYGLPEQLVMPGTPLSRILQFYQDRGDLGYADVDRHNQLMATGQNQDYQTADGRSISVRRKLLPDGGWVATHEDVTEQKCSERLLVENAAELKRINDRFDAAISNMSLGLCLFDADKRLVICNSRFQQMYGLPDELVAPGTPLPQLFEFYAKRGDTRNMTVEQRLELVSTQSELNYEPADGRVIHIQRTPTPDGGWVATHEDVTVQKRAGQMLAEKAAELEAMNVRFDAALNNMSQGLCMFDAEQKVVVSNARYGEIYNLGADQIMPGTSLRQILEFRREKGTNFAVSPETYLKENVRAANEIQELADGRVVAIARHLMANGGWLTTHEDITDRALNEKRIAFLAQHDLLTGLANRAVFAEKLEDAARRLARHGTTFTVLMLDLDRFKNVNDTLGHPAGDKLLVEVAQRLRSSLRDTDVLARLGGDEFAIVQENEKNQGEGAIALALRIIGLIEQPFDLDGHRVNVGTSIGIAFAPEHGADAETLLHKADVALYAAKSGGRNDFRVFQPELTEAADRQRSMEGELHEAIERGEFELHYQPVVDSRARRVSGVEAFVRWRHPSRGLLGPDQFLPLAESSGLMLPLGEWILQRACLDAAAWPPQIRIAVNVSAAQFAKGNLFDVVLCTLVDSGLSPERLELEIADTALLERDQAAHLLTIRQLRNLGVSIVLDDCGTGYSSAKYLAGFPFDKIKIDKSVTQGITSRRDCAAVVASVLALAQGMEIATAAKGIENDAQYEAMLAAGVDFMQGYLFGRPVPLAALDLEAAMPLARSVA